MSDLRTREKNNISKEMQELDQRIKYHERRITNIQLGNFNDDYINSAMSKSEIDLKKLREDKIRLMKRYSDVNAGLLDFEIKQEYRKRTDDIDESGKEKVLRKLYNASRDRDNLKKSNQIDKKSTREDNKYNYSINNEYKKFQKNSNSTPPFITRGLNSLPNNHGYIWRGIHYYGKREDDGGNIIMTEPMKGYSIIHETDINTKEKTLYKMQKGRKTKIE